MTPIHISVVIGSMLALDVEDWGFESRWGKNKKIKFEFARITKEQQQRLDDSESE